jgi:Fe-S-cluster containining protein
MTLTEEDVRRIDALGYQDWYFYNHGYLQMRNVDGKCFFLRDGFCEIHANKPIGCQLYPMVLDIDEWEVVMHDFCRFTDHFNFDRQDAEMLKATIETEERERRLRLSRKRKNNKSNKP